MPSARERAEQVIDASLRQADAVITLRDKGGRQVRRELLVQLRAADRSLARRIRALGMRGAERPFSIAQAMAYQKLIRKVIDRMTPRVGVPVLRGGRKAIREGVDDTLDILEELEQAYRGVVMAPAIRAAMRTSPVIRGRDAVLVTRVGTSFDRYGQSMANQFGRVIQSGLMSGATVDQVTAALVGHGGPRGFVSMAARETATGVVERLREDFIPEGLFVRHRYWAERIARTEIAHAYNGAKLETLEQLAISDATDTPKKKIVAIFDNRTADDSIAVHGQIREVGEPFKDGAGRVYMHPPARPNDRETIIPWYDDWREVPETKKKPARVRERAEEEATR